MTERESTSVNIKAGLANAAERYDAMAETEREKSAKDHQRSAYHYGRHSAYLQAASDFRMLLSILEAQP